MQSLLFRYLSLLLLVLFTGNVARAQLVVEITRGQSDAIPIAIVPFATTIVSTDLVDIAAVVAADLERSGRFAPLDRRDMIERPGSGEAIRFTDWQLLKSNFIAVGKLERSGERYTVSFELFNVLNGQRLLAKQLVSNATALRVLAHRIADMIFEQLTGIPGAFSTRIVYLSVEGTIPKQRHTLVLADADGANPKIIAASPDPIMSPAWSPDGQQLAYVSFENNASAIYVQTLVTGERRRVSARTGINGAPAWSPDGKRLAITLSRKDGDVDIYTLDLATQLLTRMTFDPGIDTEPTWSADGKQLYFTSDRSGSPQIYALDIANPRKLISRITFEGSYNARSRLSPDGKQLAVVHQQGQGFNIALIDLKSKAMQILTSGLQDESPCFSPNGTTLLYATQKQGRGVLATVSTDGRAQSYLAAGSGDIREPSWVPFSQSNN